MYIYKLVSVSLRKLEYWEGILFLTMNRIFDFDEAILSRIHLMLKDEGLSVGARTQIWEYLSLQNAHVSRSSEDYECQEIEFFLNTLIG